MCVPSVRHLLERSVGRVVEPYGSSTARISRTNNRPNATRLPLWILLRAYVCGRNSSECHWFGWVCCSFVWLGMYWVCIERLGCVPTEIGLLTGIRVLHLGMDSLTGEPVEHRGSSFVA